MGNDVRIRKRRHLGAVSESICPVVVWVHDIMPPPSQKHTNTRTKLYLMPSHSSYMNVRLIAGDESGPKALFLFPVIERDGLGKMKMKARVKSEDALV